MAELLLARGLAALQAPCINNAVTVAGLHACIVVVALSKSLSVQTYSNEDSFKGTHTLKHRHDGCCLETSRQVAGQVLCNSHCSAHLPDACCKLNIKTAYISCCLLL